MTALHIYVRPNAVHVLTDGLQRGPDGEILGLAQKVRILGHLPAIVSGRGPSELPEYFADRATWRFASFDQAVDGMLETWRAALAQYEAAHPDARSRPNMVILAGWSEARGRPECWVVDSAREEAGAVPLMNSCAPSSPDLMRDLSAMGLTGGMASFDPLKDGLRIMRAQRALRFPHPVSGEPGQIVGGFCQLSSVGGGGVGTRILERWPEDVAA